MAFLKAAGFKMENLSTQTEVGAGVHEFTGSMASSKLTCAVLQGPASKNKMESYSSFLKCRQ